MAKIKIKTLAELKKLAETFNSYDVEQAAIEELKEEGQRIINKAYETKTFEDQSFNLHDSYVSAVFYKGRLLSKTICFVEPELSQWKREYKNSMVGGEYEAKSGREEALKFLQKVQFGHQPKGLTLIVAAAMFYSSILEGHEYKVLSQVDYELEQLKKGGLNVQKYRAHIKPKYIETNTIYREDGHGSMKIF